jgi:hypothetical protein
VNARQVLSHSTEWVLRSRALRAARAEVIPRGDRRDHAIRQARLLLEVARRVAEPVERLPQGSRTAVRLGLIRDAVYWVLVGTRSGAGDQPTNLEAAWADADPERLRRVARDDIAFESLKRTLVEQPRPEPLDVAEEDVAAARAFAEGLLGELDGPRRRLDRTLFQRWWRLSLLALVLVLAGLGVRKLALGGNLLAGKPMRVSSSWVGCTQDAGCQSVLFHTEPESNPWVEFDMGAPKTFKRLEVTNRSDCCSERAIPLIAEISTDRTSWKEIGRKDTEFSTWTLKFPPKTARYLKLRIPRHSTFHLKDVALR